MSLSIIDNRARFFAIDTRFKFLAVALTKAGSGKSKREPISLLHERGTPTGLETTGTATIGRAALAAVRDDLSLPEVRSVAEWKLFSKIAEAGVSWEEPGCGWTPKFCREVDMTKERPKFLSRATPGALPLVEGRMVQAHRFGVKGHVSGTGRSALWEAFPIGGSRLSPQFWIRPSDMPRANQHRADVLRVGFCDIAGQTNERSLMASLIPSGVVCGNKVPTILFPADSSEDRLQSVPMPKLAKEGLPWKKLVSAALELRTLDGAGATRETYERMAQLRGEIDAEVAVAYGLDLKDMELVLRDFPILDRGQIVLPGEAKSTITRDSVLAAMAKRTGSRSTVWLRRAVEARALGAMAYVPSELALGGEEIEEEGAQNHG